MSYNPKVLLIVLLSYYQTNRFRLYNWKYNDKIIRQLLIPTTSRGGFISRRVHHYSGLSW